MPAWQWAIVLADLEPVVGSEEGKRRPVLVVSNEDTNQILTNLTVLPLTSTQRNLYPSEALLPAGSGGQPKDSIAMAHQIRTISKKRISRILGYVADPKLQEDVREAMMDHLDLGIRPEEA